MAQSRLEVFVLFGKRNFFPVEAESAEALSGDAKPGGLIGPRLDDLDGSLDASSLFKRRVSPP